MADLATSVRLTCTAEGYPAPTYEWYKDGVLIPQKTRPFLYIAEPAPSDRGNYTCKAINSKGETDQSRPAKLDIQGRTMFIQWAKVYPLLIYLQVFSSTQSS